MLCRRANQCKRRLRASLLRAAACTPRLRRVGRSMIDEKGEELAAVIAEIRQRVRARNPNGAAQGDIPLPDLMPLLHARDAAEAKVASIGMVNPRPGGLKNSIIQGVKRMVARALDWHVREQ